MRLLCSHFEKRQSAFIKKHFSLSSIVLFLIFAASFAHGADRKLRQFAMYATPSITTEGCGLTERRSLQSQPVVRFEGHVIRGECQVSIRKERYEQLFQFCFMSGINLYKAAGNNSFECFVQERDNDYLFLSSISKKSGKNSQVMCYFTCVAHQPSGK